MYQNKYLVTSLAIIIIAIISSGIFFSIKNLKNISVKQTSLIPEVKKEEFTQDKVVNLFNQGKFTELNELIDSQLSTNKNDINLLLQKAQALAQEASLTFKEKELGDKALVYVDKALVLDASSTEALVIKGYIYEIQQNYVDAHRYYDKALLTDSKNERALSQKGHAYQLQGDVSNARKNYEKALIINSENVLANMGLAKIYLNEDRFETAKEMYIKVTELPGANNRQKAEANYSLAIISEVENQKDFFKINSYNDKALALDSTYAQAYVQKAKILFQESILESDRKNKEQKVMESFKELDKAVTLYKNLSFAHLQLATELQVLGNTKQANLILSSLPTIISEDITLNKTEKEKVLGIVSNFKSKIK